MSRVNTKRIAVFLAAALSALTLSGCGKSSNSAPIGGIHHGLNNGIVGNGQCVPINPNAPTPIHFVAQNIRATNINIDGGMLNGQSVGRIIVGASGGIPNVGMGEVRRFIKVSPDAAIDMTLSPSGGATYGGVPVSGGGYIQLTQAYVQALYGAAQTGMIPGVQPNYNNGYMQPLCVSGFVMSLTVNVNQIQSGRIYLYFNGSNVPFMNGPVTMYGATY